MCLETWACLQMLHASLMLQYPTCKLPVQGWHLLHCCNPRQPASAMGGKVSVGTDDKASRQQWSAELLPT